MNPSAEHCNDCLHVGTQPRRWSRDVGLSEHARLSRLRTGMLAQKGCQDLHDRPVILPRIPGDPFEGVDTSQSNIKFVVSQLGYRAAEAFGDLALTREFERAGTNSPGAIREIEAPYQSCAPERLSQG
jgi:hypothetical protein